MVGKIIRKIQPNTQPQTVPTSWFLQTVKESLGVLLIALIAPRAEKSGILDFIRLAISKAMVTASADLTVL